MKKVLVAWRRRKGRKMTSLEWRHTTLGNSQKGTQFTRGWWLLHIFLSLSWLLLLFRSFLMVRFRPTLRRFYFATTCRDAFLGGRMPACGAGGTGWRLRWSWRLRRIQWQCAGSDKKFNVTIDIFAKLSQCLPIWSHHPFFRGSVLFNQVPYLIMSWSFW